MILALKNGLSLLVVTAVLAVSNAAFAESIVCKEKDSDVEYKLDFNWQKESVDISSRSGKKPFKKRFKSGTAVRNNAQDKSFLAEGSAKQFVGSYSGCGGIIETLYFDIADGTSGILQKSGQFVSKTPSCKIKTPAPDLSPNSVDVTCKKA